MKCNYKLILIFLFLIINSFVKANHLVGTQADYKCLGGGTYQVSFSLYMEPTGLNAGNTPIDSKMTINIIDLDNPGASLLFDQFDIQKTSVDTIKTRYESKCTGAIFEDSMYIWNFVKTVSLPSNTNGYSIFYWRCCRPYNQSTVEDGEGLAIELTIPGGAISCNNSPVFNNAPVKLLCSDELIDVDFSATDIDGDSLVYRLAAPIVGGDNIANFYETNGTYTSAFVPPFNGVKYKAGYSGTNPFGNNGVNIGANGHLTGSVGLVGSDYVVGVEVDEYRNGVKIGTVRRDMPVIVVECNRLAAKVQDSIQVVAPSCSKTIEFESASINSNILNWDFGVSGTTSDISSTVNPSYTYPASGSYTVQLIATSNKYPSCKDTTSTVVTILPSISADFTYNSVCNSNKVEFTNTSNLNGTSEKDYHWQYIANNQSNLKEEDYIFSAAGNYNIFLSIENQNGCSDSITKMITVGDKNVSADFSYTSVCNSNKIHFNNISNLNGSTTKSLNWKFIGSTFDTQTLDSFIFNAAGTYQIQLAISSNDGCTDSIIKPVVVGDNNTIANLSSDKTGICEGKTKKYTASGGDTYQYFVNGNPVSTQNSYSSNQFQLNDIVTMIATSTEGCVDTITDTILIYPSAQFTLETQAICEGEAASIKAVGSTINSVYWNTGQIGAKVNFPAGSVTDSTFIYTATNRTSKNCSFSASITIPVHKNPEISSVIDQTICKGNSLSLEGNSLNNTSIISWSWSHGDAIQNPTITPTSDARYLLTAIDENGCMDTTSSLIQVGAYKPAILVDSITVCSGDNVTLQVFDGNNFRWSDEKGALLFTGNVFNFTGTESGWFVVTADDQSGICLDSKDTAYVTVIAPLTINVEEDNISICKEDELFDIKASTSSGESQWYQSIDNQLIKIGQENENEIFGLSMNDATKNTYVWEVKDKACNRTLYDSIVVSKHVIDSDAIQIIQTMGENEFIYKLEVPFNQSIEYQWSIYSEVIGEENSIEHHFDEPGEYLVTLTVNNKYQCETSRESIVFIERKNTFFVPNAFVAGREENRINSQFKPKGVFDNIESYQMEIYNRWGELIFGTDIIENGWNGQNQRTGESLMAGSYLYKMNYQVKDTDEVSTLTGYVLLFR